MKPGIYVTETQAAEILKMPVETFRRYHAGAHNGPRGFPMGDDQELHFVREMIHGYKNTLERRASGK